MADSKYREEPETSQTMVYSSEAVSYNWNALTVAFDRPKIMMTTDQVLKIEHLLNIIEDNFWVKAYHWNKVAVGLCLILIGILLGILIVPILLIFVGLYVLIKEDGHHVFCFGKMVKFLSAFNEKYRDNLKSSNFNTYLSYSDRKMG